ncbi:MAG: efflux RND transporter permease subunit [Clostridium sp.]
MFSKYSVKKPLTVVVAVILVIILGFVSFTSMKTDLLPTVDLPYVIVVTPYPGASPEKVELAVTKPLEQALSTTSGIENINSTSSENSSMIFLEFGQSVNMDSVMIELSGKIDQVKGKFEEGVVTPTVMKLNPNMMPIMVASVDINDKDIKETTKIVKEQVIPEFERLDGVAAVESTGVLEERINVVLDDEKINDLNNIVLRSVDSQLADGKKQLDDANAKIQEGKKLLAEQSKLQTEQVVEGGFALAEGKDQIQNAIKDLPGLKEQLEIQLKDLEPKKDLLGWIIKIQETIGIPVSDSLRKAFDQLEAGIKAINDGIDAINANAPTLEENLKLIVEKQKEVEVGKLVLTQELTKASIQLTNGEAELEKATKEYEKARDEAYKKANLGDAITKDNISKLLMAQNFSMPAGYIYEGSQQYIVKVGDKISSIEDLENLVLFNMPIDGVGEINLNDVASITMNDNSKDMYAKINGNDGIILAFQKQSTASTAEVSEKINETIEKLIKENPDMHITALQDQGVYIDIVINSVLSNLVLGGILAVIILFLFLKNIRPTVVIAFSIPISVLFAIVMMYFSGVNLNIISLSGLALGVGMLVDNSIVVIENIYRLRNEGVSSAKAAVEGATQVAGAIFSSTLTTVCVFLPIVFTEGISRQLFTDMGLTIAYSLLASLVVALTVVPAMASTLLKQNVEKEHKLFHKFVDIYERVLKVSLKHKAIIMITVTVLLVVSTMLSLSKGTVLMPSSDSNQISVSFKMPKGSDKEDTREMSGEIIDKIVEIEDVETVGALESKNTSGKTSISLYVLLKEDKKLSSEEVGKLIKENTSNLDCELKVQTSNMDMSALGGSGVELIIKGNDLDELKRISLDVAKIVEETEGTTEVNNGLGEASTEMKITVDKAKAMKYGLTVAQVYQDIALAIKNETTATNLTVGASEYPVILVNADDDKLTKDKLNSYSLTVNQDGVEKEISLTEIATVTEDLSLASINRDQQVRNISVKAVVDSDHNVGLVSDEIDAKIKDYNLPEGYSIETGGEKESMDSAFLDLIKMISLAIVFIYLIMVAQFQSLLSPFIVLFTIPLAFTGGFLALVLTGFELSMISILGFLILSGIVVNNGIVFVDYVNQLRLEGMSKNEALIEAGRTRIRPILMTALTTILGLSTLALGIGMGADMIQPMAIVTIGGLTYATILTLVVVPIMYDILHKKELKINIIEQDNL